MRMLDDVYGAELDQFPLEQQTRFFPLELEWEEAASDTRFRIPKRACDATRDPHLPGTARR